jgi:putative addiction module component (TIGR02574 family)
MSAITEKLLLEILGLPVKTRAFLAQQLLDSLEEEEPSEEVERAWKKEVQRRYKDYKAGKTVGRPHQEVMQEAYRILKQTSR